MATDLDKQIVADVPPNEGSGIPLPSLEDRVENLEQACMVLLGRSMEYESAIEGGYSALAYLIEQIIEHAEQPHTLAEKLRDLLEEGVPKPEPDTSGPQNNGSPEA